MMLIASAPLSCAKNSDNCQLALKRLKEFVDGLWKAIEKDRQKNIDRLSNTLRLRQPPQILQNCRNNGCITFVNITRDENVLDESELPKNMCNIMDDIRNVVKNIMNKISELSPEYSNGLIFIVFEEMFWKKCDALSHEAKKILDDIIKTISKSYKNVFFVMNGVFISDKKASQEDINKFVNWVGDPEGRANLSGNNHIIDVPMVLSFGAGDDSKSLENLNVNNVKETIALLAQNVCILKIKEQILYFRYLTEHDTENIMDYLMSALHVYTLYQLSQKACSGREIGIIQNTSYVIHNGEILIEYSKCSYWNECNDKLMTGKYIYKSGNGFNVLKSNTNVAKYLCDRMRLEICLDLDVEVGRILSFIPSNINQKARCYVIQSNTIGSEDHKQNLPKETLICHSDKERNNNFTANKTFIIRDFNDGFNNFVTKYTRSDQCDEKNKNNGVIGQACYSINCIDINHYGGN